MKHADGTPMTPVEWTAERVRRWEWLGKQQRSAHPVSHLSLPLFKRYAEGELGNLTELIEEMHRHFNKRRFPQGPDGPEVFEPPAPPVEARKGPVMFSDVVVRLEDDLPYLLRERGSEALDRLIERRRQDHPDDPSIGQWVSFTASPFPKDDEDERELN